MATILAQRAGRYRIEVDRGERFVLEVAFTDSAGDAEDITGHTFKLVIGSTVGASDIKEATNTSHYDATGGITRFTVDAADTLLASSTAKTIWYFSIIWKSDDVPARQDLHSRGTIVVYPTPYATFG